MYTKNVLNIFRIKISQNITTENKRYIRNIRRYNKRPNKEIKEH